MNDGDQHDISGRMGPANPGPTGPRQPVLSPTEVTGAQSESSGPSPQVPASSVAPTVEHLTENYAVIKRTVHDFLISLRPTDTCWSNPHIRKLAALVGLDKILTF